MSGDPATDPDAGAGADSDSGAEGDGPATTRERIADRLRENPAEPGTLAEEFTVPTSTILNHVRHIARSLEPAGERLLVAPPECRDCGFTGFDDPVNRPSRCPDCKSEAIDEPAFVIRRE
jgi:predicted Zn-ribbon and HTH transcriptional regulator